jgi:hypothetical protein
MKDSGGSSIHIGLSNVQKKSNQTGDLESAQCTGTENVLSFSLHLVMLRGGKPFCVDFIWDHGYGSQKCMCQGTHSTGHISDPGSAGLNSWEKDFE